MNINIHAFKQTTQMYSHEALPEWLFWGSDAYDMIVEVFIVSHKTEREPRVTGEEGLEPLK